jgi:hypothetical protein
VDAPADITQEEVLHMTDLHIDGVDIVSGDCLNAAEMRITLSGLSVSISFVARLRFPPVERRDEWWCQAVARRVVSAWGPNRSDRRDGPPSVATQAYPYRCPGFP